MGGRWNRGHRVTRAQREYIKRKNAGGDIIRTPVPIIHQQTIGGVTYTVLAPGIAFGAECWWPQHLRGRRYPGNTDAE